ncbi:related to polyketide synthase [Fusarium torulosum]|uniref:Related to polyketide synthase n=1 Tax=Fusarium torulosum TaxID=33205 RepID=A0AAE8SE24_9HYPO|nr:related to polyketide synthase [Fusarium torulosum]
MDTTVPTSAAEPVAICGMALRLPGGINTPSQFWDFIVSKQDAQGPIPESRFNASTYYSKAGKPGFVRTDRGYFLDESVDLGALDTTLFTMPKNEVERADPQQRLLLELTRECLESAGEVNYRGKPIGTYVGSFGEDWLNLMGKDTQVPGLYKVSGAGDFLLSNRISYEYDLRGPSMTIRTGCSAALIGLHQACLAIRSGDCDSAIVGGSNLLIAPGLTADLSEQRVLSPNGSCRSFDADADGYARGDAVNVVYLKRLSTAIRDGNPIRAVIRGTFSNADGKKAGLTLPSYEGHEALIRRTYEIAGISDVHATAFVECHGTGTPIGDPIETRAVASVFGGEKGVYIGSVKPNVGHSEGASGLTALIKMVLALEHGVIPPNIKFDKPNPKIPFAEKNLVVPIEPMPWPSDRMERISVNSFGIGGANAHVVVDSFRSFTGTGTVSQNGELARSIAGDPQLVVFSANTADSLKRQVVNNTKYIEQNSNRVPEVAYTLGARRDHLPHRAFSVLHAGATTTSPFAKAPSGTPPRVVFTFTGQGAQWPRMGAELLASNAYSAFAKSIKRMDKALSLLSGGPSWSIADELSKAPEESNVNQAAYSQPLCTAVQIALVDMLTEYNVQPYAVVGHSSGELAAAYAAGRLTSQEAIIAAYYRGVVSESVQRKGAMAALGLSREKIEPLLLDGAVIACENSPSNVTISGDRDRVDDVLARVKTEDPAAFARVLKVDKAYHSYHMEEVGETYESLIAPHLEVKMNGSALTNGHKTNGMNGTNGNNGINGTKQHHLQKDDGVQALMASSVTGKPLPMSDKTDAKYWRTNLESPVLFRKAVESIVGHAGKDKEAGGPLVFLELGPHSALAGPLRQTLAQTPISSSPYTSCLVRSKHATETFLTSLGYLWQQNYPINFDRLLNPSGSLQVVPDLPTYPWQHDHSYLLKSRLMDRWKSPAAKKHELLGVRVAESTDTEPLWRNVLHLSSVPWLRDHKVKGDIIFPCAGYVGMAGEAVRQMAAAGVDDAEFAGFSVRGVVIDAAMLLHENKSTEVLTTLTRHRLTDTLDSERWEFVISSHNGAAWTKHCTGHVSAISRRPSSGDIAVLPEKLPRHVHVSRWYMDMDRVGGNYGHFFQGLTDITAATTENRALATAIQTTWDEEEFYAVHPTQIDSFLQLVQAAAVRGVGHTLRTMVVPTYIEQMDVFASTSDPGASSPLVQAVKSTTTPHGSVTGGGTGHFPAGQLGLDVRGIKMSPLAGDVTEETPNPHAAARTHWREDVDFASMASMVLPNEDQMAYTDDLRELTSLCIRESLRVLNSQERSVDPPGRHLQRFLQWMQAQPAASTEMQNGHGTDRMGALFTRLLGTDLDCFAVALKQVLDNILPLLRGEVEPLEVLMQDNILSGVYKALNWSKRPAIFQVLAHSNPHMRILEIGAGTGGTTEIVLNAIHDSAAQHSTYASYTYTDISAGFFQTAGERFKKHASTMDFRVLDITRDPIEQGFEPHSFDLIIASNVLHATPSLSSTLRNVHTLLSNEGRLYLEELTTETKAWNYIMGILPGWWLGEAEGRVDEPYVTPERWDKELKIAGFEGVDDYVLDCPAGKHSNAFMLARPAYVDTGKKKTVTIVLDEASRELAETILQEYLVSQNYEVTLHDFDDKAGLPSMQGGGDLVCVMDMSSTRRPLLDDISPSRLRSFQDLMSAASSSSTGAGILWLTRPSQLETEGELCSDPRWGLIQGAARVIRSELALDLATCEVETIDEQTLPVVEGVLAKFMRRRESRDDSIGAEYEFAISRDGKVYIPRIYPFHLGDELKNVAAAALTAAAADDGAVQSSRLEIEKPGRLNTLRWVTQPSSTLTLAEDELLIEPKAVGMNFRDVLSVMGIIEVDVLGLEHAGVVRAVGGPGGDVQVGDRVMVMGGYGFSTISKVTRDQCVTIPDALSFTDAATMGTVFATVIYALLDVGRLRAGQSLLIHSACGGVGLAALQIARMAGIEEIYCTVSVEAKRHHLETVCGIPSDRIFNSRDASFLPEIQRATHGRGVDVVLNSLSGELLHTSWDCVAEFGTMIEIGKRDLIGHGKLALHPFLLNRSYQCVDLDHLMRRRPSEGHRLLKLVVQYYREGHIQPINPVTVYNADDIGDCFLYMQKGQHIGKIVVSMESNDGKGPKASTATKQHNYRFNPAASYLLVGGLGGLGRAVSSWMVENGARHLIYLSRSAGETESDKGFFEELRSQECTVTGVKGDVTELADVQRAVTEAASVSVPLKGVINMSMVLRDHNFGTMPHEAWTEAVAPKVRGTLNLHEATSSLPLDFFLLFSSASGTFGQRGQANYAAANTFLDAFVRHRHRQNLPAQSINIGIMLDHGYVADNAALRERLLARGNYGIRITQLLDALSAVLSAPPSSSSPSSTSQLILGAGSTLPLSDPTNRVMFKTDRRMASYWNDENDANGNATKTGGSAHGSKLAAFIAQATTYGDLSALNGPDAPAFVAHQIGAQLLTLLLRPMDDDSVIDVSRSPQELGLDSLVAIELRAWWKATLQFDVSVLEMLGMPSLMAMGQRAVEGLKARVEAEGDVADGTEGTVNGVDPRIELLKMP